VAGGNGAEDRAADDGLVVTDLQGFGLCLHPGLNEDYGERHRE